MIKLEKLKQRLDTLDVFLDDPLSQTGESRYFHIVGFPETVSRGKTSFLIGGSPFLKTSTVIKVEVLDAEGEPMFVEPIDATYSTAGYKPISIVSYGDEVQGRCKLIVVAELENYFGGDTVLIGMEVPDEWKGVGEWMWLNRKCYNGLSVLPFSDHSYVQAPFEDCTEEEYNSLSQLMKRIDLDLIIEEQDETNLSGELACAGGSCEIF